MTHYRGKARNALARTLEPPERGRRLEVRPWAIRAWLVALVLIGAALLAQC